MSKHTPGPWKIDLYWKLESDPMWRCVVSEWTDDFQRMSVCGHIEEANARLIAAAPELLEALRDMYAGWQYIRSFHGDLYGVGWDRCDEKARAAIAKATGEQE